MHPNDAFIAYKRAGLDGERAELEMAEDPWDSIIDGIDQRLGFKEPDAKPTVDDRLAEAEQAARVFSEFLLFCLDGIVLDPDGKGLQTVIRRWAAVAFFVSPDLLHTGDVSNRKNAKKLPGPRISLAGLARQPLLDCDPKLLKRMVAQFMERWEIASS